MSLRIGMAAVVFSIEMDLVDLAGIISHLRLYLEFQGSILPGLLPKSVSRE